SWLRVTSNSDANEMSETGAANLPMLQTYQGFQIDFVPSAASLWGCIPSNPVLALLHQHTEVNLRKLRSGRNIAGMKRELEPYAAPTNATGALPAIGAGGQLNLPGTASIQPTLYRYSILIERAKQLTQKAIQIEATMLDALEKRDEEAYNLLIARQDLSVSQANVQLQILKVQEAVDRVTLANLQQISNQLQADHYQELINDDLNNYEKDALQLLDRA